MAENISNLTHRLEKFTTAAHKQTVKTYTTEKNLQTSNIKKKRGTHVRITTNFSSETVETRKQRMDIFKMLRGWGKKKKNTFQCVSINQSLRQNEDRELRESVTADLHGRTVKSPSEGRRIVTNGDLDFHKETKNTKNSKCVGKIRLPLMLNVL